MDNTLNISNEDYILWDLLTDKPLEQLDVVYHYTSLEEVFRMGSLPPYVKVIKLTELSQDWQIKISEAIQLTN